MPRIPTIEDFETLLEQYNAMEEALENFIDAIDEGGGVITDPGIADNTCPVCCPGNSLLGEAYLIACDAVDADPLEADPRD